MLTLVTEKKDKAAIGSQASKLETHPERRFKAAVGLQADGRPGSRADRLYSHSSRLTRRSNFQSFARSSQGCACSSVRPMHSPESSFSS